MGRAGELARAPCLKEGGMENYINTLDYFDGNYISMLDHFHFSIEKIIRSKIHSECKEEYSDYACPRCIFLYSQIGILTEDLKKAFTRKCPSCNGNGYVKTIENLCGECNSLGVKIPQYIFTLLVKNGDKKTKVILRDVRQLEMSNW